MEYRKLHGGWGFFKLRYRMVLWGVSSNTRPRDWASEIELKRCHWGSDIADNHFIELFITGYLRHHREITLCGLWQTARFDWTWYEMSFKLE